MLVVADSSPINILIRIECTHVLPALFGTVVIPPEVRQELSDVRTPDVVRLWMSSLPAWLSVHPAVSVESISPLNLGEQAAISLAREMHADALLIDDLDGRRAAAQRGLVVIGTLGVLERAAERALVDLEHVVTALRATDFRLSESLLVAALQRDRMRRGLPPT